MLCFIFFRFIYSLWLHTTLFVCWLYISDLYWIWLFHLYGIHHTLYTLGRVLGPQHVTTCLGMCDSLRLTGGFDHQVYSMCLPYVVYYEEIKWELNRRRIYECRCGERINVKVEGSTRLPYTRLCGGLEHLKIETRLLDERFVSDGWVCNLEDIGGPSILRVILNDPTLSRMLPTFDLRCEENATRM